MLRDVEIREIERLFRAAGYDRPVRVTRSLSDDERVFVVEEDALMALPIGLTTQLQQALGRKVWIMLIHFPGEPVGPRPGRRSPVGC